MHFALPLLKLKLINKFFERINFMSDKKVIAVLGATGAQGSGLVRAILNDKNSEFKVRALTRNINSDKAKALAKLGVELMSADVDNYESLKNAFAGAYGVYAVTFFWEHFSGDKEIAQAKSIARAAKEQNVQHLIWSSLEDTRKWIPVTDNRMPTLQSKFKVPHYDAKGESNKFFTEAGIPTTILNTSFYWENFIYFGLGPKKGEDGKLKFILPMGNKKLPGISSEDIGKCAYAIFKKGKEFIGKTIGIAGGHLTGQEMANGFSKILGQEVNYISPSFNDYRSFGFSGADEMGNMFQFKHDFEEYYCGARNLEFTKSLNPELKNFDTWLRENKEKILLQELQPTT
jgi:uncharacterized protein YbjT (DUF2867 family)